jgi:hypothetical protein
MWFAVEVLATPVPHRPQCLGNMECHLMALVQRKTILPLHLLQEQIVIFLCRFR